MPRKAHADSMGQNGFDLFTGTAVNTPDTDKSSHWIAVMALGADAVVTTLSTEADYGDNLDGKTLPANVIIPGVFTTITRASGGDIIAWRAEKD